MSHIRKIIVFVIVFSTAYWFVHVSGFFDRQVLFEDLGGLPWLYSTIGVIFSMLAAFIIQKEWDHWNMLVDSVKNEADSLHELWLWSKHFPDHLSEKFHYFIRSYAEIIVAEGLEKVETGHHNERIDEILNLLYDDMFELLQQRPELMPTAFSIFTDIIKHRMKRLHDSIRHMPEILKYSFQFSAYLLIVLSLFIGVKNIWLDFLFTFSIAALVFSMYIVVDDLDNPLRPGIWHLTTHDYDDLLQRIKNGKHPAHSHSHP